MTWKAKLQQLKSNKEWNPAITFMQEVIASHPNDLDAYLYMNFLLMNLLAQESYDENKHEHYKTLAKKYFDESYAKFSEDPEYLYYTGMTAVMSEWFFGITDDDYKEMFKKAIELEPNNILYQSNYYIRLNQEVPEEQNKAIAYAKIILDKNSFIQRELLKKGELGEYILGTLTFWGKHTLGLFPYKR